MRLVIDARQMVPTVTGTDRYASSVTRRLLLSRPDAKVLLSNFNTDLSGITLTGGRYARAGKIWSICGRNSIYLTFHNLFAPFFVPSRHVIISNLDIVPFEFPESYFSSTAEHEANRKRVERVLRRASKIISISQFSKKRLVEFFGVEPDRIRVVYLAPTEFNWSGGNALEKDIEGPYILCLGGTEPRKNVNRVISAYKNLDASMRKEFKLVVVGGRWPGMDGCLSDEPGIFYVGSVSDQGLMNLYRNAAVFVYASLYEGFGMPILEAMSFGCPVITSNCTSMPEAGGDASVYVDPYDENSIADALQYILSSEDVRSGLIRRGTRWAKRFSWENTASEIDALISECQQVSE